MAAGLSSVRDATLLKTPTDNALANVMQPNEMSPVRG